MINEKVFKENNKATKMHSDENIEILLVFRCMPVMVHHFAFLRAVTLKVLVYRLYSILDKISVENKFLFDGTPSSDLNYSFFYFESVALADSSANEIDWSLICYLCGRSILFYYRSFPKSGDMYDGARSYIYTVVKATLRKELGV